MSDSCTLSIISQDNDVQYEVQSSNEIIQGERMKQEGGVEVCDVQMVRHKVKDSMRGWKKIKFYFY